MSVLKCKNKNCKNEFTPYTTLQRLCVSCAILKAKSAVKKERTVKDKAEKKELKQKLKTVTDYRNDARYWFQRWIRIRDLGKTCISCNSQLTDIRTFDAGHYYNAKSYPQLLFNEFNVNGQCKNFCNNYMSGNLIEYRKGLIERYGVDVLLDLDELADDKTKRTLTKEYYQEIETEYKRRCKLLEK